MLVRSTNAFILLVHKNILLMIELHYCILFDTGSQPSRGVWMFVLLPTKTRNRVWSLVKLLKDVHVPSEAEDAGALSTLPSVAGGALVELVVVVTIV
jgi:hypothetical protein